MTQAWYTANLTRAKTMPNLAPLLRSLRHGIRGQSRDEMRGALAQLAADFGRKRKGVRRG